MSVQAMTAVFRTSKLGGTTRLVMLAIANYYGDNGAWPSIDSLAGDCRMSRRAIQDCLRRAEESGELHVEANAGQRGTNRYWFHIEEGGCRFCTRADVRRESAPEPKELGSSSVVPKTSSRTKPLLRERNPQFDALAEIEGLNLQELDTGSSARLAVALAKIRKVTPDLTPGEIFRRAKNYGTHFPDATLTANALAKWWARLGEPARNGHHEETTTERMARLEQRG